MAKTDKNHELIKRKKERKLIFFIAVLLISLFSLQVFIVKEPSSVPFSSEIAVFALLNINLVLLLILLYLVIRNVFKVFIEQKKGIGSRIKYKLVFAFLILSVAPAFLLFFISSSYIAGSFERWFNIQIERSLDESLKVAKTFYRNSSDNALFYSKRLSSIVKDKKLLDQENLRHLADFMREKKKEYNLESVEIFSAIKETLVKEIPEKAKPTDPNSAIIQDALGGKDTVIVEESQFGDIIRASVPIFSTFLATEPVGVVVVSNHIPHSMVSKMQIITETYEKYAKLLMFKKPLKSALIIMLLITTLIIIFTSIRFGMHMAKQITEPIDEIADAAAKVSAGDMEIRVDIDKQDEIGHLARAFNKMLNDLKSKGEIIEAQSNYLKVLMNKVSTGIISVTPAGNIATSNEIFRKLFETSDIQNKSIDEVFPFPVGGKEIKELLEGGKSGRQTERIIHLIVGDKEKYVKMDVSPMYDDQQNLLGIVGVFDDITEGIRFQKMLAWREVARKVAHEIKNPLTPIQLSANRLKKRYEHFIGDDDRATFNECINVIVSQVDDIKNLINEFSNYGRMPAIKLRMDDITPVLNEVFLLFKEAHKNINFSLAISKTLPMIYCDNDQLKRALINLVTNAVEAIENADDGVIELKADYTEENNAVSISLKDNGKGIKKEYKERLFEPYFSRKMGGTGLGLYIVSNIITQHRGSIKVSDAAPKGSEFTITLPVNKENV